MALQMYQFYYVGKIMYGKFLRKFAAMLLALCLILGSVPTAALSDESQSGAAAASISETSTIPAKETDTASTPVPTEEEDVPSTPTPAEETAVIPTPTAEADTDAKQTEVASRGGNYSA